jgi:hypothetical protein
LCLVVPTMCPSFLRIIHITVSRIVFCSYMCFLSYNSYVDDEGNLLPNIVPKEGDRYKTMWLQQLNINSELIYKKHAI